MFEQWIMLFLLLLTGFSLCRIGILNKTVNLGINKMVMYFAFPCLTIYKIGTMQMDPSLLFDFLLVIVLGLASFAVFTLAAAGYCKVRGIEGGVSRAALLSMVCPNNGFFGYPIAILFLGQPGLLLMIAHGTIVLNGYCFTYGLSYLRKEKEVKIPMTAGRAMTLVLKLLLNPVIISIPIGVAVMYFGVPLDNVAGRYLEQISDMAAPLAMIYVGSVIGEGEVLKCVRDKTLWEISMFKLIADPVIMALLCIWTPLDAITKAVLILAASFPCAALPIMLGQQEDVEYGQAANALLLSTILSFATIPVLLKLLSAVLGI